MKKLFFILFIFYTVGSFSQSRLGIDLTEPPAGYKYTPAIINGIDTTEIHTLTLGISLVTGEVESTSNWGIISTSGTWNYVAAPFVSLDYNFALNSGADEFFNANDGASPLVLNIEVTAGVGGYFLIFPIGINGTAGLSTDFKDVYLK